MALNVGARVGAYEIVALLGRGGMGDVWRARDLTLRRDVALKVVAGELARTGDSLARFEREAQLLASLNHPHIAAIYGVEQSTAGVALVLELVEGPTLADLIARGRVAVPEALRIARQIAEALEAAHDRGIIHRDLKPANVKLTSDNEVKVLDFGLAKVLGESHGHQDATLVTSPVLGTEAGVILGTAAYMSPEQAKGQVVDRRSDIWSFGSVLYEMLTGRRAFEGDSLSEVMVAVLTADVDFARLPDATPPAVCELLRRCLDRDPRQRLRDIGEARILLEHPNAQKVVHGVRTRATSRAALLVAGGVLVGVVAALAGFAVWPPSPEPEVRPVTQVTLPLTPAERLAPAAPQGRPTDNALTLSPDGRTVIFAGERGSGDSAERMLYRRSLDEAVATPIAGSEGASGVFLSPDGASVAFVAPDATLRRLPVAGGAAVVICALNLRALGGSVVGASWGDDGTIVFGSFAGPLWTVRASGGTPVVATTITDRTNDYAHRLPHQLPGSRGIIYMAVADGLANYGRLELMVRGLPEPRVLVDSAADARYLSSGHLAFVRRGTVMLMPFDLEALAVTGAAAPVHDGVLQAIGSDLALQNTGAAQYAVSNTGTLVHARGGPFPLVATRLLWLHRDGRTEPIGDAGSSMLGPRMSPDGTQIIVAQPTRPEQPLRVYDIGRKMWTGFPGVTGQAAFPAWTPDSQRVVFTWFNDGRSGLYISPVDGSTPPRLIVSGPRPRVTGDVSSDGRMLAYGETDAATGSDIWVVPLDRSTPPRALMRDPGFQGQPMFSPDGRWLAYASDVSGRREVFIQAFPGPGARLQASSGGGAAPVWSRDGHSVVYATLPPGAALTEVEIQTVPSLRAGRTRTIAVLPTQVSRFARSHDVTAEGQRFVVATYEPVAERPVTELQLIDGWLASATASGKR